MKIEEIPDLSIPPRSQLYHLEPMGVGTPMVECLSSYCSRLAKAHNVKTSQLIRGAINPEMICGGKNIYGYLSSAAGAQNGFGKTAELWVKTLGTLTLRNDLSFLTMLPYRGIISHNKLLRPFRAWCPRCLSEMRAADDPIVYEPLLWKLQPVQVCPVHHQVLEDRCPQCRKQLDQVAPNFVPGYCSSCGYWLAGKYGSGLYDMSSHAWHAGFIGEMLALAPNLSCLPQKEDLGRFITKLVDTRTKGGGASALGKLMRINPYYVTCWGNGEFLPHFTVLLKICWRFKADIHQVLRRKPLSATDMDVEMAPAIEVIEEG